jgi:hypothetical protein
MRAQPLTIVGLAASGYYSDKLSASGIPISWAAGGETAKYLLFRRCFLAVLV